MDEIRSDTLVRFYGEDLRELMRRCEYELIVLAGVDVSAATLGEETQAALRWLLGKIIEQANIERLKVGLAAAPEGAERFPWGTSKAVSGITNTDLHNLMRAALPAKLLMPIGELSAIMRRSTEGISLAFALKYLLNGEGALLSLQLTRVAGTALDLSEERST
ncbi:MAG: hypothetical protein KAW17_09515 [Candidatus Eisenbacteria sp.]|nr:hypothetical protein [Candidatus Eisenbacteria bacterium]